VRLSILVLVALLAALAGYFGPWTWHPAVAFRYSADDLAEFAKYMPVVRAGQLAMTRELFYLPVWLASIGLAVWLGRYVRRGWIRWSLGLPVLYAAVWPMPTYPFIVDAYRSPEFGASFWGSVVVAGLCMAALGLGHRMSDRAEAVVWIVIGALGAAVAPLLFIRLKPALDALHSWPMSVGWGIFATMIGFAGVAVFGLWEWIHARKRAVSAGRTK